MCKSECKCKALNCLRLMDGEHIFDGSAFGTWWLGLQRGNSVGWAVFLSKGQACRSEWRYISTLSATTRQLSGPVEFSNVHVNSQVKWPINCISKPRYSTTSSTYSGRLMKSLMWSVQWSHFQWPRMTINPDFKCTPLFDVEYLRNDTR